MSFKRGETEYQITLPLGGFVTMAGQHPGEDVAEDAGRTFLGARGGNSDHPHGWAGPNLLFPIVALFFVFYWGDRLDLVPRVGRWNPVLPLLPQDFGRRSDPQRRRH